MPEQMAPELVDNLRFFTTLEALEEYSVYCLDREEKYLFAKYYLPGDSVLDLACGLGRTTVLLHEMGLAVRGIDASEVFINLAQRRFPYLNFQVGDFARIEAADASYSHVLIADNGLDCAFPESHRLAALRECARVLKTGGTLIYSAHNLKSMHFFSKCYARRPLWKLQNCRKAFQPQAYLDQDGLHIYFASPEFVIRQTESMGFQFLEMVGTAMRAGGWRNRYYSPYIHYAFRKSSGQGPNRPENRNPQVDYLQSLMKL